MHDVRPTVISLCVCAALALGACERATHDDTASDRRDHAEARSSSGAATRRRAPEPNPRADFHPVLPPEGREQLCVLDANAVALLMKTSWFNSVYFGEGGRPSYEVLAFNEILKRGDTEAIFEELLRHADQAGQLYATSGFYPVTRERFELAMGSYAPPRPWVWTSSGCYIAHQDVHDILVALEAGHAEDLVIPAGDDEQPLVLE